MLNTFLAGRMSRSGSDRSITSCDDDAIDGTTVTGARRVQRNVLAPISPLDSLRAWEASHGL